MNQLKRLAILCITAGAVIIVVVIARAQAVPAKITSQTPSPTPKISPSPAPDPLTIAAIQARTYTASPISLDRDLGSQGGYHDAVVSYQSDGLEVFSLLSIPDGAPPAGGWPTVILAHGYINPSDYKTTGPEYREFIATLARAGYVVFKPDYRGHGQSQGQPEGGHFSPVYTYDIRNLIESIKHDARFNPSRIGLFGHSLGGHTVLRTIVTTSDVKAAVIASGVVGSFYDLTYNWPHSPMPGDRPLAVQTLRQQLLGKYGTPKDNPTFWDSASAVNYVKNITAAVQIHHSVSDSTVPKTFSDHLAAAMAAAGKTPEYYQYPGDDHQLSAYRSAVLSRMLAFYRQHL